MATRQLLPPLKNQYYVLRHGTSEANKLGIIVSDPINGVNNYGLTSEGKDEVRNLIQAQRQALKDKKIVIYTSDFKRAHETAKIVSEVLNVDIVHVATELRERYFGHLELLNNTNYNLVWEEDLKDDSHQKFRNESAEAVVKRTTGLIRKIEKEYEGYAIILTSHGDSLQLLQTAFEGVSPSLHRSLPHLKTAELRTKS